MPVPLRPDGHLWTKPEEKCPEGATHLVAIYGRDGHLWLVRLPPAPITDLAHRPISQLNAAGAAAAA
jgi:hypothetical protein